MKCLNRSVLIIIPREPFFEWANNVFPDNHLDGVDEVMAYLLDDDWDATQAEQYLKENYDYFFEEALNRICTYPEAWPEKRSFIMFSKWFEWHYSSVVWDLLPEKRIMREEL